MPSVSPARAAAFDILLRVERESSYASELLHASAYASLSAADHHLATQLVMGVIRWRSWLDAEIATASSQPLKKLDLEILIALRLAVYQFGWLDRIPKHAALNESVELVKRARKRSAVPFVNAVLRKITQQGVNSDVKQDSVSADALALDAAHPQWLVERWIAEYGFDTAHRICDYDQTIPVTSIRLRTPDAEQQLLEDGVRLRPGALLANARTIAEGDVTRSRAFRDGTVVIQDEASQLVAELAARGTQADSHILDCCAAPGGKTLAIADRNPASRITAIERHSHRARRMKELWQRASNATSASIKIVTADARHLPLSRTFDRVLADVPCSGTGTLARNPEIKWRLQPEDLVELHQRQVEILRSSLAQVAPGGRVIYSTCSLEPEENVDVVQEVLSDIRNFRTLDVKAELELLKADGRLRWPELDTLTRAPYLRTIPGVHPCDGFFAVILERT